MKRNEKKKALKKLLTCIVKADEWNCVRYEKSLSNKFDFEGEYFFMPLTLLFDGL